MTVKGSVFAPTETMTERDTMESIRDGLLKAASAARELAKELQNHEWEDVAVTLDAFNHGIKQLADMRSMSRFETLMAANLKSNPKGFLNGN